MKRKTQQQIADQIGLSRRTIAEYKRAGVDIQNPAEIAERILASRKPPEQALEWASRILTGRADHPAAEFHGAENLESLRDHYQRETAQAIIQGDRAKIKYWNDLLLKTDESLRRTELHRRKLGIEQGEMLSKDEIERILKAVIYAGNACVRNQLKEICQVLASESNPNAIYQKLAPAILGGRLFEGFKAVMKSPSKVQLPEWIVDVMQSEGENYLKGVDLRE